MHPSTLYHWLARLRWPLMLILLLLGLVLSLPTGVTRVVAVTGIAASSSDRQIVLISTGQVEQLPDRVVLGELPPVRQAILSANGAWAAIEIEPDHPLPNQPFAPTIQILQTSGAAPPRTVVPQLTYAFSALSNDGRWLLIRDMSSYQPIGIMSTDDGRLRELPPETNQLAISNAFFTPTSNALIIVSQSTLHVIATDTWQLQMSIALPLGRAGGSTYAPLHRLVAIGNRTTIVLYSLDTQQPVVTLRHPLNSISFMAFSPDEQYLLVTENFSSASYFEIWPTPAPGSKMVLIRLQDGAIVQWFRGPQDTRVTNPRFTADGRFIASFGPHPGINYWPVRPWAVWLEWLSWVMLLGAFVLILEGGIAWLRSPQTGAGR